MKRKRGPNRVNSLQLSLFDAIIAIDETRAAFRRAYAGKPAPPEIVMLDRKLAAQREQLRMANARIARLAA